MSHSTTQACRKALTWPGGRNTFSEYPSREQPWRRLTSPMSWLGPVDGFHQDQSASKCHKSGEAFGGFLTTHSNALEPLQFADGLLDACPPAVEPLRKEAGFVDGIRSVWDHRNNTSSPTSGAIVLGVVALVGHSGTRRDIGTDVERGGQLCAIADLAASQMEGDRQAIEVGFEVDFAGKSAARTPERLILLPPFGPGRGDVRANDRAVEHLDQMRCLAGLGQELEERLDDAGSAESPEALPDAVPRTERRGKRAPGQIMDREKMQCLQELAVVPPRLAAARLSGSENLQHDRPVVFRHSSQHSRPSLLPVCYESEICRFGNPLF